MGLDGPGALRDGTQLVHIGGGCCVHCIVLVLELVLSKAIQDADKHRTLCQGDSGMGCEFHVRCHLSKLGTFRGLACLLM